MAEYNNNLGKIDMLTGPNYHIWAVKMKAYLKAKKLFQEVIIDDIPPESDDPKSKEWKIRMQWSEKNDETFSIIILSLAADQAGMYADEWLAKNIWENLEKMYAGDRKNKIIDLTLDLKEVKMNKNEKVDEYFTRIKNINAKINSLGGKIDDDELNYYTIRGINEKFENIAVILRTTRNMKLEQIHTALKEEEKKRDREYTQHETKKTSESAYKTNQYNRINNKPHTNKTCYICGKQNHIAKQCWYRKTTTKPLNTKNYNKKPNDTARTAKEREYKYENTQETYNDNNETHYALGSNIQSTEKKKTEITETTWHIDSGCSTHMTSNKEHLQNIEHYKGNINLAEEGRTIKAEAKGDIQMTIKTDNKPISVKLQNVLYVPQLKDNLLSVREMIKNGNEITFSTSGATVYSKDKIPIIKATEIDNMYTIKATITHQIAYTGKLQKQVENEKLWHRRLGHLNLQSMKEMEKRQIVHGIEYQRNNLKQKNCDACIKGKLTQTPYPKINHKQSKQQLELLHIDLCGPIHTKSLGGNAYIFTIVDDYTRMIFVEIIKHKNDAYATFLSFKAQKENEINAKIKRIRSDNGTEFINQQFEQLFKKEGIKHEKTTYYSPASNGLAERTNRTLLDTARTLLIDSKLPDKLWGEAINTTAYIRNRTFKQRLGNKTPMEMWNNKKPTIKHLKVFGCKIYTWIPKQLRENKLSPRAIQGIFVGYSRQRKAYRVYLPTENKIHESRNVKFIENEWGIDTINIPNPGATGAENIKYQLTQDESEQNQIENKEATDQTDNKRGRPFGTNKGVVPERNRREIVQKEKEEQTKGARRSSRNIPTCQLISLEEDPKTYQEAINSKDRKKWEEAMEEELNSLRDHNVWELRDKQDGMKILKNKWIFTRKKDSEGNTTRFKARLVAVGNKQVKGIDYEESYSPVLKLESVRLIIAIAARLDLKITRYDVKTAYLHGELKEATYMQQPDRKKKVEGKICHLKTESVRITTIRQNVEPEIA